MGANPGEPVLPLTKVASGGELARTMLAVRLAAGPAGTEAGAGSAGEGSEPSTLVFDEVDAGIGGEAAVAVGRALAALGSRYQVLVVTHLPQVAAFADHQLVVHKQSAGDRTVAEVRAASGPTGWWSCPGCFRAARGGKRRAAMPRSCWPRPAAESPGVGSAERGRSRLVIVS